MQSGFIFLINTQVMLCEANGYVHTSSHRSQFKLSSGKNEETISGLGLIQTIVIVSVCKTHAWKLMFLNIKVISLFS